MNSPARAGSSTHTNPYHIAEALIGKDCPICLSGVEVTKAAVLVPCSHAYCRYCIRRWGLGKRNCPLCNASFETWFYFDPSSRTFQKERLWMFGDSSRGRVGDFQSLRQQRRLMKRYREESRAMRSRARPLQRRRTFEQTGDEHPDVIAERVKQWRASIYQQQLQAIPLPSKNSLAQMVVGNSAAKEKLIQKIEPWIQRELQAVLRDPDPAVIVHVATSLFISRLEKENEGCSAQIGSGDDFLASLRPFLQEQTEIFWHELRCFAECSLCMGAYDRVVEYKERN